MRLKPTLPAAICSLVFWLSAPAMALPEDSSQPIQIGADSASMNDNTGVTVYRGNVEIEQGSMKIRGDQVELYRSADGDVDRIVSIGRPAEFEQKPNADDPVTHAYGLRMEYRVNRQEITITQEARVEQGKDTFSGQRIVYNMDKAIVNAFSSESGDQRVKMVIQPKQAGDNP
ncbi:lipopolysaccharide transport periplasmic protein LptA [Marinobacterium sp. YM272]|uniref:lipopolysaccharide transport periplasmic protein LptA n=1 Tax=Marinobacterium sp. YM272 TaxID=3421654 RepID=UPI003D7F312B